MEKVDVFNKYRENKKITKRRGELVEDEYRISVHIWIKDLNNKILIEKRSNKEDKFPGMWAQVGGGVKAGESSKETVFRECIEELDFTILPENLSYVASYIRARDIVDEWLVEQQVDVDKLKLQEDEVEEIKLVTFEEFDKLIKDGNVVPSINPSYYLVKNYIENYKI